MSGSDGIYLDMGDKDTARMMNIMLANASDVNTVQKTTKLKQIITNAHFINCSDFNHIEANVAQYGIKFDTRLLSFEDDDLRDTTLLHIDGKTITDVDENHINQLGATGKALYRLNKDEVSRLYDAGLYDEPIKTIKRLRQRLIGQELDCIGKINVREMNVVSQAYNIGQPMSTEAKTMKYRTVKPVAMQIVLNDQCVQDDLEHPNTNIIDVVKTATLSVIANRSIDDENERKSALRKEVKYEMTKEQERGSLVPDDQVDEMNINVLDALDFNQAIKDTNKEQDVSIQKQEDQTVDVDTAIDFGLDRDAMKPVKPKESTQTLSEQNQDKLEVGSYSFDERYRKLKEQQLKQEKDRKRKKTHERELAANLDAFDDQKEEDVTTKANKILTAQIANEHADSTDSTLVDRFHYDDDDVSPYESKDQMRKREANQKEFHTTDVSETKARGPKSLAEARKDHQELVKRQNVKKHKSKSASRDDGPDL